MRRFAGSDAALAEVEFVSIYVYRCDILNYEIT
jgi:hypothetical protein